jgi:sec-independent protein translocase protein TatA
MDFFLAWQFGPIEIALIAMAALLLFGKRLPEVARSMGKGISEFKKGIKDVGKEVEKPLEQSEADEEPGGDERLEG